MLVMLGAELVQIEIPQQGAMPVIRVESGPAELGGSTPDFGGGDSPDFGGEAGPGFEGGGDGEEPVPPPVDEPPAE